MLYPWVNIALLAFIPLLLATGFWGLLAGESHQSWVMALHGVGGYAVIAILGWKGAVIVAALRQRRRSLTSLASLAFLMLTALLLAVLSTGLAWVYAGPSRLLGVSTINLHAFMAVALAVLLAWHFLARRFVVRMPQARDRRAVLNLAGAAAVGLGAWLLARPVQALLDLSSTHRRFTGSYETGSFTGIFPATSWLTDNPSPVDVADWDLTIGGAVRQPLALTYESLHLLATGEVQAVLDCTGGWYTEQHWQGIPLSELLERVTPKATARGVVVESVTGYRRRFPLDEARDYLLAISVANRRLSHGHGFPLRLVAPDRRGFEWVKWVTHIEVIESEALWQSPLPLQ